MAGDKYLKRDPATGLVAEEISADVSTGVANAGDIVALDSTGRISQTMMPVGIGPDTKALFAAESLTAGDLVYIADDGGTTSVFKASADVSGSPAIGFVDSSYSVGEQALVYFEGVITGFPD